MNTSMNVLIVQTLTERTRQQHGDATAAAVLDTMGGRLSPSESRLPHEAMSQDDIDRPLADLS